MAARRRTAKIRALEKKELEERLKKKKQKRVEASRKLREAYSEAVFQRREERDVQKEMVRYYASDPAMRAKATKVRQETSDFLANVVDELKYSGVTARFSVVKNKDLTIDAELRVPYPDTVRTIDDATDVLNQVEETFYLFPHMQFITVGFTLNPRANDDDVRATALQYQKYEGELRLNPNYYDMETNMGTSFQAAYEVLRNVTKAHGMLPTGMLIRLAWSTTGWLMRRNDTDIRKPAPFKRQKKEGKKRGRNLE